MVAQPASSSLVDADRGCASPGNNGTVKIDGVEFDEHRNNEPHVGCIRFEVDWYGFEASVAFDGDVQDLAAEWWHGDNASIDLVTLDAART